jgi:vacuolar-type H+-ATPase subunit F/Vma7
LIGPEALVRPLGLAGIDVFGCDSAESSCQALSKAAASGKYGMIFITENLAEEIKGEVAAAESAGANLVFLPDHRGSSGFFKEFLHDLLKKATGAV